MGKTTKAALNAALEGIKKTFALIRADLTELDGLIDELDGYAADGDLDAERSHERAERLQAENESLRAQLAEAKKLAFDEQTWQKLETFVKSIYKLRQLEKHARDKKAFAAKRELGKLVDKAVEAFIKSMQIEEV